MNGKFKVWDSKKKYLLSKDWDFLIHQDGKLYFLSKSGINKADPWFIPIFSTGKTDKNGVELFDGDRIKFKDYHHGWNPAINKGTWDAICTIEWNQEELKFSVTEDGNNKFCFASTHWFCLSGEKTGSKYEEKC